MTPLNNTTDEALDGGAPANYERRQRARNVLDAYRLANIPDYFPIELDGPEPDEADLRDLLCDLMHLAAFDTNTVSNFNSALESARSNFTAENDQPYRCAGCGREESECSRDPCPDVIADREAVIADITPQKCDALEAALVALLSLNRRQGVSDEECDSIVAQAESALAQVQS